MDIQIAIMTFFSLKKYYFNSPMLNNMDLFLSYRKVFCNSDVYNNKLCNFLVSKFFKISVYLESLSIFVLNSYMLL